MRSTSATSVTTRASVTAVATTEPVSMESSKGNSEGPIPLEAKEMKRRGHPRKEQKKSGRSHGEKDLLSLSRTDRDSKVEDEDNGKADGGKRSG